MLESDPEIDIDIWWQRKRKMEVSGGIPPEMPAFITLCLIC